MHRRTYDTKCQRAAHSRSRTASPWPSSRCHRSRRCQARRRARICAPRPGELVGTTTEFADRPGHRRHQDRGSRRHRRRRDPVAPGDSLAWAQDSSSTDRCCTAPRIPPVRWDTGGCRARVRWALARAAPGKVSRREPAWCSSQCGCFRSVGERTPRYANWSTRCWRTIPMRWTWRRLQAGAWDRALRYWWMPSIRSWSCSDRSRWCSVSAYWVRHVRWSRVRHCRRRWWPARLWPRHLARASGMSQR
jgi:hypothetical protein